MTPDLSRFVEAQAGGVYDRALGELERGAKTSHWMWFVFPQLAGLGRSPTAQHFAIRDLAEARAYLDDTLLGPRLAAAAQAMLRHADRTPGSVLGAIDAVKLRSSATLFEAAGGEPVFAAVLDSFYGGDRDPATLDLLRR